MKNINRNIVSISFFLIALFMLFIINITYSQNGGVAINSTGTPAAPSAELDIQYTDKGLLIPRMTTAQRNTIASPAQALQIFNITTNCLEIYINQNWHNIFCECTPPSAPTAGTNIPGQTQIEWNWNAVSGATGYKFNTTNDYNSAVDIYTNTSYTQTGLNCNTSYTLYVWSYNVCGSSSLLSLTQATTACSFTCGTGTVTFTYNGSSVTYGTVTGPNNTCWLDRNLGAIQVATAYNDIDGYGDLFQWGRLDDGHQLRNSAMTTSLSSTDIPGHSYFITVSALPYDWRSPQNDNLWQGAPGINNPCPLGWRMPLINELDDELLSWSTQNYYGAIISSLKIPTAGVRINGYLNYEGIYGYYWSSTISNTYYSRHLFFHAGGASCLSDTHRSFGESVRCIKD